MSPMGALRAVLVAFFINACAENIKNGENIAGMVRDIALEQIA